MNDTDKSNTIENPAGAEGLAKALADHFNPPHWEERRRTDLPHKELKKLPWEERYEQVWIERDGDATTDIVFTASDGYAAIRSLTFNEIAQAVIEISDKAREAAMVEADERFKGDW